MRDSDDDVEVVVDAELGFNLAFSEDKFEDVEGRRGEFMDGSSSPRGCESFPS